MNTENKLYEKFTWLKQDLIYAGPKGNKAQFKGIALLPTISGNGRKYVQEELHRSARTLVGKPLTLNHNPNKVLGDVTWAEFENGSIEYVAETKNNEYIEKLKDCKRLAKEAYVKKWGRDPIYGVSVEANYRFHDQQCVGGHCTIEPHGIIFNALSLVEDPERPGVSGTTVEIMETLSIEKRLSEMIVKDIVPKELHNQILEGNTMTNNKLKEEECDCPPGQHKDESGQCVPDNAEDDRSEEMLEIKHQLEKAALKTAKEIKQFTEALGKVKVDLSSRISEVDGNQKNCCNKLGETQKLLLETEAIAKGTLEKLTALTETVSKIPSDDKSWEQQIATLTTGMAEAVKKAEFTEALNSLPKPDETIKPLLETVNTRLTTLEAENKTLKETLDNQHKKIEESDKKYGTLNTVYEALNQKYEAFVKETEDKKIKETQDSKEKIQKITEEHQQQIKEMQDQIDTLKLHVPPKFKAKLEEKKPEPNFKAPYAYS